MVIDGNIILRAKSITCRVYTCHVRGFVKFKKNKKIRAKLGIGRLDQAPTLIFYFFGGNFVFLCISCVVFMFSNVSKKNNKKMDRGWVGLV